MLCQYSRDLSARLLCQYSAMSVYCSVSILLCQYTALSVYSRGRSEWLRCQHTVVLSACQLCQQSRDLSAWLLCQHSRDLLAQSWPVSTVVTCQRCCSVSTVVTCQQDMMENFELSYSSFGLQYMFFVAYFVNYFDQFYIFKINLDNMFTEIGFNLSLNSTLTKIPKACFFKCNTQC